MVSYILGARSPEPQPDLVASRAFDYDSIMLYDSFAGGKPRAGPNDRVLERHAYKDANRGRAETHSGGSKEYKHKRISDGDIEQLRYLYPPKERAEDADSSNMLIAGQELQDLSTESESVPG